MRIAVLVIFVISIVQMTFAFSAGVGTATGLLATFLHIGCAFTVYTFHGRKAVTPLGLFALSSAFFLGIPYLYGYTGVRFELGAEHNIAAVACLYALCGTALVGMLISPQEYFDVGERLRASAAFSSPGLAAKMLIASVLVLAVGWLTSLVTGGLLRVFQEAGLFDAFVICVLVTMFQFMAKKPFAFLFTALLTVGAMSVYYLLAFSDTFGRLRLASLGFAVLVIFTMFRGSKLIKLVPVALSPLFLIWSGMVRMGAVGFHLSILTEASGLGSMLAPFTSFAQLLGQFPTLVREGIAEYQYGATYLYNITFWVPRTVWENKPVGLGRLYVAWFMPGYLRTSHSIAGSYMGEAYVNFGIVGILLAPLIAGAIVGCISRYSVGALTSRTRSPEWAVYLMMLYVILTASIPDYVWADTNTFTQRALVRAVTWTAFWMLVCFFGGLTAPRSTIVNGEMRARYGEVRPSLKRS